MRNFLVLLSVTVATVYCAGNETAPDAPFLPGAQQPVSLTRLATGSEPLTYYSGITEPARLVVRDLAGWTEIWGRISPERPAPPLPMVDFSREMVIVAALGTKSSGGHSIVVESAAREGGALYVVVRTETPASDCLLSQALTSPLDVARIPRTEEPVQFRERSVSRPC